MLFNVFIGLAIFAAAVWGTGALWYQAPAPAVLVAIWLILAGAAAIGLCKGAYLPLACFVAAWLAMQAWWWLGVRPSNDRAWMPEVAEQTYGSVSGDMVTLHNVRDFEWRSPTDFDERWVTRTYDLSQLQSVDLVLSYWGRPAIAHTMVSFGFADGQYVVFSVEIRRKSGDEFSEIGGFFRRYELSVLASTETDSLRVRTNVRDEDGYLYRVYMPEGQAAARALFLSYLDTANQLRDQPRFYNTITANCTTIIYQLASRIVQGLPLDYRLLVSGYLPEYLYDLDALRGAQSIEEYRRRGHYTERARASRDPARFSHEIRQGVPGVDTEH
ncbi:Lnb N-terminal periplasmic domain-containing protein [Bordetella sp. 02P26C-1]|uniref:Lnb N-terminal periplasmic domain-containing protein n=1 Tax=Bordetella sp. 02P26C-1 TaxID=2683195 RepID=UPI001352AA13|nr:DUF4105 domain-containing protein [Bordetella sp. 02P26C-1]MVW79466.1 DUF4105 domain-containing protein [Bordetella sp. 02P26C-1]